MCFNWANCANTSQWWQPLHFGFFWILFVEGTGRARKTIHRRNPVSADSGMLCMKAGISFANFNWSNTEVIKDLFVHCIDPVEENKDAIFPLYSSYNSSFENWPLCDLIPVFNPLFHPAKCGIAYLTPAPALPRATSWYVKYGKIITVKHPSPLPPGPVSTNKMC